MDLMYTIQPGMIVDYAGYFVLGHYLSHYEIPKKTGKDSLYSWSRSDHNSNPALSDHVTAGRKRDTGIL